MKKSTLLFQVFLVFILINAISAQNAADAPWSASVHISPSFVSPKSDWSMSHPFYSPTGGISYETITGTFEQSMAVNAGFELSKGDFGFRGDVELMPQALINNHMHTNSSFNLLIGKLSILYFPPAYMGPSLKPYIALGGGLLKATGDIDNQGLIISFVAGSKVPLTARYGLLFGLEGLLAKYTQLQMTESITKDISINMVKLSVGISYKL